MIYLSPPNRPHLRASFYPPRPTIIEECILHKYCDLDTVQDLITKCGTTPLDNVKVRAVSDDNGSSEIELYEVRYRPDPTYEKRMAEYVKAKAEDDAAMAEYRANLASYERQQEVIAEVKERAEFERLKKKFEP